MRLLTTQLATISVFHYFSFVFELVKQHEIAVIYNTCTETAFKVQINVSSLQSSR